MAGALSVNVTLENDSALRKMRLFVARFPEAIDRATQEAASFGKRLIIKSTPVKTGDARKSWELDRGEKEHSFFIVSRTGRGANYTPYLEYGTGIYGPKKRPITPVNAKYLFYPIIKGNKIMGYRRRFSVRGIRPFGMIANNVDKIQERLVSNIKKIVKSFGAA